MGSNPTINGLGVHGASEVAESFKDFAYRLIRQHFDEPSSKGSLLVGGFRLVLYKHARSSTSCTAFTDEHSS